MAKDEKPFTVDRYGEEPMLPDSVADAVTNLHPKQDDTTHVEYKILTKGTRLDGVFLHIWGTFGPK